MTEPRVMKSFRSPSKPVSDYDSCHRVMMMMVIIIMVVMMTTMMIMMVMMMVMLVIVMMPVIRIAMATATD